MDDKSIVTKEQLEYLKVEKAQKELRERIKRYINQDKKNHSNIQTPEEFIRYSDGWL